MLVTEKGHCFCFENDCGVASSFSRKDNSAQQVKSVIGFWWGGGKKVLAPVYLSCGQNVPVQVLLT